MIPWVVMAEKEERKKDHDVQKALLGYDPETWLKIDAEIRVEELEEEEYQSLSLIPPTKGKHRFAHCQVLYEEVHVFLTERRWAPAQVDSEFGGVTWVELFALFDLGGTRSEAGQHIQTRRRRRGQKKGKLKLEVRKQRRWEHATRRWPPCLPLMKN